MLTKGEPLSKELRFRLRGYTAIVLVGLIAFQLSAYLLMLDVCACHSFDVPFVSAKTVRLLVYGMTGLLYVVAWIEVVRMLRARWWPHWGTLASSADPQEAARPIPRHILACALIGTVVSLLILDCEIVPDRMLRSATHVGVVSGIGGAILVQFGAWFIRVCEPFLPLQVPKK